MSEPWECTQGWVHCILYVLFENAMGVVKLWAVVAGARPHLGVAEERAAHMGASAPMCSVLRAVWVDALVSTFKSRAWRL